MKTMVKKAAAVLFVSVLVITMMGYTSAENLDAVQESVADMIETDEVINEGADIPEDEEQMFDEAVRIANLDELTQTLSLIPGPGYTIVLGAAVIISEDFELSSNYPVIISALDSPLVVSDGAVLAIGQNITVSGGSIIPFEDTFGEFKGINVNGTLILENGANILCGIGSENGHIIVNKGAYVCGNGNAAIDATGGIVEINNGAVVEGNSKSDKNGYALYISNGEAIFNGGILKGYFSAISASSSILTIRGGIFESFEEKTSMAVCAIECDVTVSGNPQFTASGKEGTALYACKANVTVDGGNFSAESDIVPVECENITVSKEVVDSIKNELLINEGKNINIDGKRIEEDSISFCQENSAQDISI